MRKSSCQVYAHLELVNAADPIVRYMQRLEVDEIGDATSIRLQGANSIVLLQQQLTESKGVGAVTIATPRCIPHLQPELS